MLTRAAHGDHAAFKIIFDHYAQRLHDAVNHYTKSSFIADELTQEVFIRLWRHREKLTGIGDVNAYLYRMIFNQINTYLRKESNEAAIRNRAMSRREGEDNYISEQIEAKETASIIQAAIERLPDQKKIIYRLNKEQGLTYNEIAGKLNISPNTVRNHLVEAVKMLRISLSEHTIGLSVMIIRMIL